VEFKSSFEKERERVLNKCKLTYNKTTTKEKKGG